MTDNQVLVYKVNVQFPIEPLIRAPIFKSLNKIITDNGYFAHSPSIWAIGCETLNKNIKNKLNEVYTQVIEGENVLYNYNCWEISISAEDHKLPGGNLTPFGDAIKIFGQFEKEDAAVYFRLYIEEWWEDLLGS